MKSVVQKTAFFIVLKRIPYGAQNSKID